MNIKSSGYSITKIYQEIDHLINNILMPAIREMFTSAELGEIFAEFLADYKLTGKDLTDNLSKDLYKKAFIPWLLFNWGAYKDNNLLAQIHMNNANAGVNKNLMQSLILNAEQKEWITRICNGYYSFYRVISEHYQDGSLILQDMLLETEIKIKYDRYRYANNLLTTGIIFAKIVPLLGQTIIVGIMPVAISNYEAVQIVKLRQMVKREVPDDSDINDNSHNNSYNNFLTADQLRDRYELFLRKCYFSFAFKKSDSLSNLIELKNYDGDELCYCDVVFDVSNLKISEDEVANFINSPAHLPLSAGSRCKLNNGLNSIGVDNIILDSDKLTIEVDSKENAEFIKEIMAQQLQTEVSFNSFNKITVYSIKQGKDEYEDMNIIYLSEPTFLPNGEIDYSDDYLLEMRCKLSRLKDRFLKMLAWNLQNWSDTKMRILDDRSPREAMKTPDGAELVEEILQYFDRYRFFCSIGDEKYRLLFSYDCTYDKKIRLRNVREYIS